MLLQLFGLAAIVVFSVFVARTAKENGRNRLAWTAACVATGLGLQWIVPIFVVTAVAITLVATGTTPDQTREALDGWALLITIVFLILSVIGMFLILRKVAVLPDEDASLDEPPPPTFYQTE